MEVVVANDLGNLPVVGSYLDGLKLTAGYAEEEMSMVANSTDRHEATVALTGALETLSLVTKKN